MLKENKPKESKRKESNRHNGPRDRLPPKNTRETSQKPKEPTFIWRNLR